MIRLEVAVAAPLQQTLSYLFDHEDNPFPDATIIGKRVLVPLGGRKVTGYVLRILPEEKVDYALKRVIAVLDSVPLFHENLIPFFRWIATYYHFPLGEVIRTALPGGLLSQSEKRIVVTQRGRERWPEDGNGETPQPAWRADLLAQGMLGAAASKKILNDPVQKKVLAAVIKRGYAEIAEQLREDGIKEKGEVCYSLSFELPVSGDITGFTPETFADFQAHLQRTNAGVGKKSEAKTLCHLYILAHRSGSAAVARKELLQAYPGAAAAIPALVAKGLLHRSVARVFRNPFGARLAHFPRPETLTHEQEQAVALIFAAIEAHRFQPFLLHGVTGSGKTEVYLRAAEKVLAVGKDVLVLVPEIALAMQLESHLVSRFGDQVVLLHSGLSAGERFDQWSLAAAGRAKIVIGARSALFAPLKNPGLIVVDEEHDQGYKQDESLRYQGRDLAVLRARYHQAVVLLGSATPSVTSYYHAMTGKYTLLRLTKRVADRPLPAVVVVDLRKKTRAKGVFRPELKTALAENLARREQSLLLMNRRGFSANVICQDCGTPVECRHCHVSLVYHKKEQRLICHYCGYNLPRNLVCSRCRSASLVPVGFGTERIEEEVRRLFPDARVARLDADTAADRKKFHHLLKAMYDREVDILIGTQIIAKGHHFPFVTLVGVVWADGSLNIPDFRAAERTFQLLAQVTGRAGRGENPGRVIIQTMQPDHYAIVYARSHLYEALYERELEIRRLPLFPPFVRLIAFLIHGKNEAGVRKTAAHVAAYCRERGGSGRQVEVLGPAPAPLDRLCDRYRWQVLLKGADLEALHAVCGAISDNAAQLAVGDARITVDVDPENMM